MGYYSDIAIRIEVKKGCNVNEVLKDFQENVNNETCLFNLETDKEVSNDNDSVVLFAYGLKWYDTYDDVRAFYTWCEQKEEEIENGTSIITGIQFIRIGEDLEDNEECVYGDLNEYIRINRSFEWD